MIFNCREPREFVQLIYERRKRRLKTYSHEAFARELGYEESTITYQIVKGTRRITDDMAKRLSNHSELSDEESEFFLLLFRWYNESRSNSKEAALINLLKRRSEILGEKFDEKKILFMSQWHHVVVRELVNFPDFRPDPVWISRACRPIISSKEAAHSFRLLQQLNLIEFDAGSNRWKQVNTMIEISDSALEFALSAHHEKMMQLAQKSLNELNSEQRNITGASFSVTNENFKQVRERVSLFLQQLANDFGHCDSPHLVAQLNLQLFTLSQWKNS